MIVALSSVALTSIIAASATVLAALVGGAFAAYNGRVRIREIELTFEQQLQQGYLESARAYTRSVYVPLSIEITRLAAAYVNFRDSLGEKAAPHSEAGSEEQTAFRRASESFLLSIEEFSQRGSDAFLTNSLEALLLSFTTFLRRSLRASESRSETVFLGRSMEVGPNVAASLAVATAALATLSTKFLLVPLIGGASAHVTKLVEAPLTSPAFEERFIADVEAMKSLIKEVTLGAQRGQ